MFAIAILGAAVLGLLIAVAPWWVVAGVYAFCVVLFLALLFAEEDRSRRRVAKAEKDAEFERRLIRTRRERAEALRCHGGVLR